MKNIGLAIVFDPVDAFGSVIVSGNVQNDIF